MGNSYSNITIIGPAQDSIAETLRRSGAAAWISQTFADATVVFPEKEFGGTLLRTLSADLNCPALQVFIYDDDSLLFALARGGELLDTYDSCPGVMKGKPQWPQGGDAELLCEVLNRTPDIAKVREILRHPAVAFNESSRFAVEIDRHLELVRALTLPEVAVAAGYSYLEGGEWPDGMSPNTSVRIDGV